MATETFTWAAQGPSAQGEVTLRVRAAQFGDGYAQVVPDGINNKVQSWPLKFVGDRQRILEIKGFLDRHKGARAFFWTPPLDEQGLYRARAYSPLVEAPGVYGISVTFEQAFAP